MKNKESYNTDWIVELLAKQYPKKKKVIENLKNCKEGYWKNKAYIYFVIPENPNKYNSKWQFKENIILEDKKEGTIVLDILKQDEIGGIEFIKRLR